MWLWLMRIATQYQLMMSIGQSQAMWQCKWRHLVAKIETEQGKKTVQCTHCALPWIALLALSVSIELVSSSARVTSVKSNQRSLTHGRTSGPKDRTPGLPGSDKKLIWKHLCPLDKTAILKNKQIHDERFSCPFGVLFLFTSNLFSLLPTLEDDIL